MASRVEVPFFRPSITDKEIDEVTACLRSGWLTTGPRTNKLERRFAEHVGAQYAVAVNSCTAALHLAMEALGLKSGQAVLVPTMTFAATAEAVSYQGAVPIPVDCDPVTLNLDLTDAERKVQDLKSGRTSLDPGLHVVGIVPVYVGGLMMDIDAVAEFAAKHRLWIVEDAAHAFPAAFRKGPAGPWRRCGENTAAVTCFSFYANKTITTGEGGMAVSADKELAARMRLMSLHGMSRDAWNRYSGSGTWDYRIVAPGFKYNMTDVAAAVGLHQLERAEAMREAREAIAQCFLESLKDVAQIELPLLPSDRVHAWHLFPIRLNLERLSIDRNAFMDRLREHGIGCSVHWRPLHLHPYYRDTFHWRPEQFPVATSQWERLISLPIFPEMVPKQRECVIAVLRELCSTYVAGHSLEAR